MRNWYVRDSDGAIRGPMTAEEWMKDSSRSQVPQEDRDRIASDRLGDVHVSTVFLGLDHSRAPGRPLLFETMIFEGKWDQYQWRYSTEAEARKAHAAIVAALMKDGDPTEAVPS